MECQLYVSVYIFNLSVSAQTHLRWRRLMRHSDCCTLAKFPQRKIMAVLASLGRYDRWAQVMWSDSRDLFPAILESRRSKVQSPASCHQGREQKQALSFLLFILFFVSQESCRPCRSQTWYLAKDELSRWSSCILLPSAGITDVPHHAKCVHC